MKPYGVNELRRMYLDFFESKEHLKMKSFSLVPHNDNSLLIINSGMAPLKPYFTGQDDIPFCSRNSLAIHCSGATCNIVLILLSEEKTLR